MLRLNVCHNNITVTNLGTVLLIAVQKPPARTYPRRYLGIVDLDRGLPRYLPRVSGRLANHVGDSFASGGTSKRRNS